MNEKMRRRQMGDVFGQRKHKTCGEVTGVKVNRKICHLNVHENKAAVGGGGINRKWLDI